MGLLTQTRVVTTKTAIMYPPQVSGFTGLLDTYPGAAFGYSFRKLRSAYAGSAVRIRESGGNTESNIGFDGSGNFNSAAAASFIGANSGFIVTWYDQSGNGLDVTQATSGNQPAYSATGLNSLPSMSYDGSNDILSSASIDLSTYISTQGTIFAILNQNSAKGFADLYNWTDGGNDSGNRFRALVTYGDTIYFDFGSDSTGRVSAGQPTGWDDNPHLLELNRDSSDLQRITVDGTSLTSATKTADLSTASASLGVGSGPEGFFQGFVSELVCWGTDLG